MQRLDFSLQPEKGERGKNALLPADAGRIYWVGRGREKGRAEEENGGKCGEKKEEGGGKLEETGGENKMGC